MGQITSFIGQLKINIHIAGIQQHGQTHAPLSPQRVNLTSVFVLSNTVRSLLKSTLPPNFAEITSVQSVAALTMPECECVVTGRVNTRCRDAQKDRDRLRASRGVRGRQASRSDRSEA
jgi:hypothetical protein